MPEPTPQRLTDESSFEVTLPTRREMRAREAAASAAAAAAASAEKASPASASPALALDAVLAPSMGEAPAIPVADAATAQSAQLSVKRAAAASARLRAALKAPPRTGGAAHRNLVRSFVTFAVVPGLFLTAALPAYAFMPGDDGSSSATSAARIATEAGAQSIDIASFSPEISVSSDNFTSVSGEEIQRLTLEAERLATEAAAAEAAAEAAASRVRSGANGTPGVRQEGDDYPWAFELTDNQGGGLSPLNYYYRECVDFVAWRLNRDAGATGPFKWVWSNLTPGGGSAYNWANEWNNHGWSTSYEPITGAVAWFTGNHVAYVQSVPGDGTVVLEEYNWGNDHSYHRRTVAISDVPLFLYPPP